MIGDSWGQTSMADGVVEFQAVLGRLRCVVECTAALVPAAWRVDAQWSSASPGAVPGECRRGPYLCRRFWRGGESLALWYATAPHLLAHDQIAATCGGVARVCGAEPDDVIRYVYTGANAP